MERRQLYCSLPSNKNRHDEVRWASSLVPASPIVLDWGPGLCVSACQTHQTRHELGESLFSFFSNPTRRHLAQLCTSEASPQSLVSRQLSVIWKTTGLRELRKAQDLQFTLTGFRQQLHHLLALGVASNFSPLNLIWKTVLIRRAPHRLLWGLNEIHNL